MYSMLGSQPSRKSCSASGMVARAFSISRCAFDEIVEIQVTLCGVINPARKDQDGIEPVMSHGIQMAVRKLVKAPSGMHHARGKQGFPNLIPVAKNGRFPQIHQIFQVEGALANAALVMPATNDCLPV